MVEIVLTVHFPGTSSTRQLPNPSRAADWQPSGSRLEALANPNTRISPPRCQPAPIVANFNHPHVAHARPAGLRCRLAGRRRLGPALSMQVLQAWRQLSRCSHPSSVAWHAHGPVELLCTWLLGSYFSLSRPPMGAAQCQVADPCTTTLPTVARGPNSKF